MPSHAKPPSAASKLYKKALAVKPPLLAGKKPHRKLARYESLRDRTLTRGQVKLGFRPEVVARLIARQPIATGAFRFASNPTAQGHSSGYHEAFVVTDMTDKLSKRAKGSGGLSTMPVMTTGHWQKYSGKSFPEKNVAALVQAGDGARTDTARTVLSGPGGTVAGHSGSGVVTTGQSAAHDLLRDQAMRTLSDNHMTPEASAVISAATTVFTMAPGVLASRAGNAHQLKDSKARGSWEADRNEAKERLALVHDSLKPSDKLVVRRHMKQLVIDVGGTRELDADRPSSPRRRETTPPGNAMSGGDYDRHTPLGSRASVAPPVTLDSRLANQYVSAPFRGER